jgi:hypothetical protein
MDKSYVFTGTVRLKDLGKYAIIGLIKITTSGESYKHVACMCAMSIH